MWLLPPSATDALLMKSGLRPDEEKCLLWYSRGTSFCPCRSRVKLTELKIEAPLNSTEHVRHCVQLKS